MFFANSKKKTHKIKVLFRQIYQKNILLHLSSACFSHKKKKKSAQSPAFSYVWYWRDLVRSVMRHNLQWGSHCRTARFCMIQFLQEMNFGNWHFHGVFAKEMDPTVLLLSTKASSSQWIHEVWEYNSNVLHWMPIKIHVVPPPSKFTMSDKKLLKHGVM